MEDACERQQWNYLELAAGMEGERKSRRLAGLQRRQRPSADLPPDWTPLNRIDHRLWKRVVLNIAELINADIHIPEARFLAHGNIEITQLLYMYELLCQGHRTSLRIQGSRDSEILGRYSVHHVVGLPNSI